MVQNSLFLLFKKLLLFINRCKKKFLIFLKNKMTTPEPEKKAQFYFLFNEFFTTFTPDETPMTFSLPAGTKFPNDLTKIMEKTKRYFTFQSIKLGETLPTCKDCVCSNCTDLITECKEEECKGFVSSVDDILCDNPSCVKTNDTKYYIVPMWPTESSLPHYNPKFKFIKVINSTTKIEKNKQNIDIVKQSINTENETSAEELLTNIIKVQYSMALFSVSYPSLETFNTKEKFNELYELCKQSNILLALLKEDRYLKHNNAMLQQIIKINQLPTSLLKQDFEKVIQENNPLKQQHKAERINQLKSSKMPKMDEKLQSRLMASKERQQLKGNKQMSTLIGSYYPTSSITPTLIENYESDDIQLKDLNVPISTQEDTTPDILLTEESKLSGWIIFGICIGVLFVILCLFILYKAYYSKKTTTISTKR